MNRFENAIGRVGGYARLAGGESNEFAVSVQPQKTDGDSHTEIGTGFIERFNLYTICDSSTEKLGENSLFEYLGETFRVENIQTVYLSGMPIYRRGSVVCVKKGELDGKSY